jgi:carbon monoxide dehydrogenase subunit G
VEFDNAFEVPVPPEQAWKLLMDIERIAPCVPGAALTQKVDDRTYKGTIAVKLGPVALTFAGQAKFEEMDEAAKRARVKAQGSDAKGRGGASATVGVHLEPSPKGAKVLIHTNLQLSGAVAQYGRGVGMVKDLAQAIIGQFAANLEKNVIAPSGAAAAEKPQAPAGAQQSQHQPAKAPPPPPPSAAPVQMGGLGLKVLWMAILRGIKRLFGGG